MSWVKVKALDKPKAGKSHSMIPGKVYEVSQEVADILVKKKFVTLDLEEKPKRTRSKKDS